jgi:biopolymer transport protein ExbD
MSSRCQCPHCGTVVSIYERALGRKIRCPGCDQTFEARPYDGGESVMAATPPAPSGAAESTAAEEPLMELPVMAADQTAAPPVVSPPKDQPPQASGSAPRKALIFRQDRKSLEAEMDMTPMVDVTFQLLIFFMLTASFTMQKSLNVPKPESTEPSTAPKSLQDFQENPDYVVVRIDATGTYYVTAAAWPDEIEAPAPQELRVRLREARQGDAQGNVPSKMLVFANGEALHERVVTAIDAGNDVGMDEVQLVTVEDDEAF